MQAEALSKLPLFRTVPPDALHELIARCSAARYTAGQVVFQEGDPASGAVLLVDGRLEVSVRSEGKLRHVAEIKPGEIVGEQGLFSLDGTRNATVMANRPSVCLRLTPDALRALSGNPAIAALEMHLIASTARRIRHTNLEIQKAWKADQQAAPPEPGGAAPSLRDRLRSLFGGRK